MNLATLPKVKPPFPLRTGLRSPSMTTHLNPLEPVSAPESVPVGVTIKSLQPSPTAVCYVNGNPVYRMTHGQISYARRIQEPAKQRAYIRKAALEARNWINLRTQPGDVIEWVDRPNDKETFRTVLSVAAIVVSIFFPALAPYAFAAVAAYNLLVPPSALQMKQQEQPNEVYVASLSGNAARLDQAIWKNCGLVKITPPFAAIPYYEFRDGGKKDGGGNPVDFDQYYYAVLAVGLGNHNLKAAFIGKTPLSSYQDVIVANYLPPGTQPAQALCNVVTSEEVNGAEILQGEYVGPFVACQPKFKALQIGVDILTPTGLGKGSSEARTVTWRVEGQYIDDFGTPSGPWFVLANETRTAATNTPQRWSYRYTLASPGRVQVRVGRTNLKDTAPDVLNELQWGGLRAYLQNPAPLNPDCAHYEVVMRASKQLTQASTHQVSLIVHGLARTWNPDTGWSAEVETRNPMWWLADLWTSDVWGENVDDQYIALENLYAEAVKADLRQDHFDFSFTTTTSAWDAAQLISRAARCRAFERFSVRTVARDEWTPLPVTAFTHRNTDPGSMVMSETLPDATAPDGVVVEYTSNVTWDIDQIECPAPGFTVTDVDSPRYDITKPMMSRPEYIMLSGIMGKIHAEREGLYEAAVRARRTRVVSCKSELQAVLANYMAPIRWLPDIVGYGQTGDVAVVNGLEIELTERPDFTQGDLYISLLRDDGTVWGPVLVTPASNEWRVMLPTAPDFTLVVDDPDRERPKFLLGTLEDCDELVKVTKISDSGESDSDDGDKPGLKLFDITALVDDEAVHTQDIFLLPGPGEIQDPISFPTPGDAGPGGPGNGDLNVVALSNHFSYNLDASDASLLEATYTLLNNGTSQVTSGVGGGAYTIPLEWMLFGVVDVTTAALYEVYFEYIGGFGFPGSGPFVFGDYRGYLNYDPGVSMAPTTGSDSLNTWLSLGSNRTIKLNYAAAAAIDSSRNAFSSVVRVTIREAASQIVQATAVMTLSVQVLPTGNTP